eukprot:TRINITY_DN38134_c0_g1_i1.p1 TRINITY_DN38134_c0_g1~~TRINITY_DN38134_c0_g1_i1.p1  ORF type:complete len:224 (+),score=35.34 TRINITY_DN38134_c0_g1_i1:111-782(+)
MAKKVTVVFVRHGERLDEADYGAWCRMADECPEAFHDPPLTGAGRLQAAEAGRLVVAALSGKVRMYASPSVRTLGTAAHVGEVLGVDEVMIAPGLYACSAAAKRHGVENLVCAAPGSERFTQATRGAFRMYDTFGSTSDTFSATVESIVNATPHGDTAVLVTHREGIYSHSRRHGKKRILHAGYCCTCHYTCKTGEDGAKEWSMVSSKVPVIPEKRSPKVDLP